VIKHGMVGDLLIRAGLVDSSGLARAIEVQVRDGVPLARAIAHFLASEHALIERLNAFLIRRSQ